MSPIASSWLCLDDLLAIGLVAAAARLHFRIANVRNDALHKFTHQLTTDYGFVAIEDLHVKEMMRNRKLSR